MRCRFAGCGAMHKRGEAAKHEKEAGEHHARSERNERMPVLSQLAASSEFVKAAPAEIAQATASKDAHVSSPSWTRSARMQTSHAWHALLWLLWPATTPQSG